MRFADWRQQARLASALVWLAEERDVASAMRAVGYESVSAFTRCFTEPSGDPAGLPRPREMGTMTLSLAALFSEIGLSQIPAHHSYP
jgi:hypothetical protein